MTALTNEAIRQDADFLQKLFEERFAYTFANDVDYKATIDELRGMKNSTPAEFGFAIHKVLAHFIDGHVRVSPDLPHEGFLPFLVEAVQDRVVAVRPDRSGFVVDDHPYVTGIDGLPIARWLEAASQIVPVGSPHYEQYRSVRNLQFVQQWRTVLGLPRTDTVTVEFGGERRANRVTRTLPVAAQPFERDWWPEQPSQILPENIGYLRLLRMNDESAREVREWMPRFRDTDGLIVDVRDNGGGRRDTLFELMRWLIPEDEAPMVASVAAYRRWEGFGEDHMDGRFMFRANDERLNDRERESIRRFAATFRPEVVWSERSDYSDWHYLVLSGDQRERYHYDKPVVVLMNSKCFSASDIFLGSMKLRSNVRLLGEPSSGGSAFAQFYDLPNSGVTVRLGSMISFQTNGLLYDTRGISPNVIVVPEPTDYIRNGTDTLLDRALKEVLS